MALSRVIRTGDGTTVQFVIDFALGYISEDDVTCRVGDEADGSGDPVYRTITFLSDTLVEISGAAPGDGVQVVFDRTVEKESKLVNFSDGDILDEDNLDTAFDQILMAVHEVLDGRFTALNDDLDMGGFRLVNAGDPVDPQDAATKAYVDANNSSTQAAAAAASAAAAATSANTASSEASDAAAAAADAAASAALIDTDNFAATSLFSPGILSGEVGSDKADIRDYETAYDITSDNAVLKIQAAIDANESDVLHFPAATIPILDTIYSWRQLRWVGTGDSNFWKEAGDSTGGSAHPVTGTLFATKGAGTARRWTDMGSGDVDTTPVIALLGDKNSFSGITVQTGYASTDAWDTAFHICGSRGHNFDRVQAYGLGENAFSKTVYIDGTWSKINDDIWDVSTGDANFAHVRAVLDRLDRNLLAVGPTDIRFEDTCIFAGVWTMFIQGRLGSYPAGDNPYGPNGISDLYCGATLYNEGPLLDRMTDGGLIHIDYQLPNGNPVVNSVYGDNGQNMTFDGRHDIAAKYLAKIKHGHLVRIREPYAETSENYQEDVADYNTANATSFETRGFIETDDTCTGFVEIQGSGSFVRIRPNSTDPLTALRDFPLKYRFGHLLSYDGRENGEQRGPLGSSSGWLDDTTGRAIYSLHSDGLITDAQLTSSGIDTFFRRRINSSNGDGELSTNGADWFQYETGTFTPVLSGDSVAGSHTYADQAGTYTRVGNLVFIWGVVRLSNKDASMAGNVRISGLPFNAAGARMGIQLTDVNALTLSSGTVAVSQVASGNNYLLIEERSNTGDSSVAASAVGNSTRIGFSGTYEVS